MAETLESISVQVVALSASVDARFEQVDKRFDKLEKRVEDGFAAADEHFAEQRAYTEFAFTRLEQTMNARFDRVERKLDQFIETQLQTNQLVDRRLRALKSPRTRR